MLLKSDLDFICVWEVWKCGSIHRWILFLEDVHLVFICFGLAETLWVQTCSWLFYWFVGMVFLLQCTEDEVCLYLVPTKFLPSQNFWWCILLSWDDCMVWPRAAQISGTWSPRKLKFVSWLLTFVGCQYGVCIVLPIWYLEFWGGFSRFLEIVCTPGVICFMMLSVEFVALNDVMIS